MELVVMLYDGALRFMTQARAAIERGDVASRRDHIARALAILSELQSTLNVKDGGAIAESLDELYSFLTLRLMDASFKKSTVPLDEALRVLTVLRDAWSAVASQQPAPPAQKP
jgi:flagellar protein FliS